MTDVLAKALRSCPKCGQDTFYQERPEIPSTSTTARNTPRRRVWTCLHCQGAWIQVGNNDATWHHNPKTPQEEASA